MPDQDNETSLQLVRSPATLFPFLNTRGEDYKRSFLRTSSRRNSPPASIPENVSHRVWIGDLPLNTSVRQLLSAIRGIGGVVEVQKGHIKAPMINGSDFVASLATVVFADRRSARTFLLFVQCYGILLKPKDSLVEPEQDVYRIKDRAISSPHLAYAYPIAKPSAPYLDEILHSSKQGHTRLWRLAGVSITTVWFILNTVGLQAILHATYDKRYQALDIEFFTVTAAVAAKDRLVEHGTPYFERKPFYNEDRGLMNNRVSRPMITFRRDQCDKRVTSLFNAPAITPWISDREFEELNVLPYNINWPTDYHPCMDHARLRVRTESQQWDLLTNFDGPHHITRDTWSWNLPLEVQESWRWLTSTINTPEWEKTWARWFRVEGARSDNLARLYDYVAVAQHRRETAGTCDGNCGYGCNIRNSPVPQVVQDFLAGRTEVIGNTEDDNESSFSQAETLAETDAGSEVEMDLEPPSSSVDVSTRLKPVDKFLAYVNMKASWGLFGRDDLSDSDYDDSTDYEEDDSGGGDERAADRRSGTSDAQAPVGTGNDSERSAVVSYAWATVGSDNDSTGPGALSDVSLNFDSD